MRGRRAAPEALRRPLLRNRPPHLRGPLRIGRLAGLVRVSGFQRRGWLRRLGALFLLTGCTGEVDTNNSGPPPRSACRHELPGGACLTVMEACPEGFAHDGDLGCEPVLPDADCPPGQMATPGERACRPVAPCREGRWGDAPDEPGRQHLDASYAGPSDGSEERPWTTLSDAIQAAPPGGLVAITDGSYAASVRIEKPVRLWGRCPEAVELVGGAYPGALVVFPAGSGSEFHDLAVRGTDSGLAMSGATEVLVSRVWFHDNAWRGVVAQGDLGPTSLAVVDSLFENNAGMGLYASGTRLTLARSEFRQHVAGEEMAGAGTGVHVVSEGEPVPINIADVVVRESAGSGFHLSGVSGDIERIVVTETRGDYGVYVADHPASGTRSVVRLAGALIETSQRAGMLVIGSDAELDRAWIRGVNDPGKGQGIQVQSDGPNGVPASLRARRILVGETAIGGLISYGASVDVAQSRFYATRGVDEGMAGGIILADSIDGTLRGQALLHEVEVVDATGTGILVAAGSYEIRNTRVARTLARADGLFGDGLTAIPGRSAAPADVSLDGLAVDDSARAAVAVFSAHVALKDAVLACAAFDISMQRLQGYAEATLDDRGGNVCGCPDAESACKAALADLVPPTLPEP